MSTPAIRAIPLLPLPLLVLRLGADHEDRALSPDDLALVAALLYGRPDFHSLVPHSTRDATPFEVIMAQLDQHLVPRDDTNEVHPHLSRDVREDRMSVLEFHLEHGVGEGFRNGP